MVNDAKTTLSLRKENPIEQGLKRRRLCFQVLSSRTPKGKSNRTRIETRMRYALWGVGKWLRKENPIEQGLKRISVDALMNKEQISERKIQ